MFLKLCVLIKNLSVCLFVNFGVIVVCFVLFPFFYWILESRESFGHVYSMFHYINIAMFHYIKNVLFLSTQDCDVSFKEIRRASRTSVDFSEAL